MKKAILATKVGMTQIFNADGVLVPVTVLQAGPCVVTQIKTVDNDGYSAVQVGFVDKKEKTVNKDANGKKEIRNRHGVNKAQMGHFAKAGVSGKRFVREFKFEGLKRIRFMTSHPKDLSDDLIMAIKECDKVCKHMHLPLQSGSSRVLKEMNRHYDKEKYLDEVKRLREQIPDIAITTDIIVGFPGETEEDFLETMDVVKQVRYDSAFTFIYSKRTGTRAATMENQVPDDVVKDRFDRLLKEVQTISSEKAKCYEGKVVPVLAEEMDDQKDGYVTGRMDNNSIVHFPGTKDMIGNIYNVKLDECRGFYYMGEIKEDA